LREFDRSRRISSVLESDGVSPVAIIGIHQLDAVGKLAPLYGRLDVAIFIGSGVYRHDSIMLDLGSKPCATHCERPPIR